MEAVEVRFRLDDGSDIGPSMHDQATTVTALKEFVLARWPQGKEIAPRTVNDVTIINAGQVLENNRTLAESRNLAAESPEGPITMHVVVRRSRPERRGTIFFLLFVIMFVDDIRVSQIEIITVCPSFSYPDILKQPPKARPPERIGCGCTIL
uniref:UBL3-like ubiquitin domain-containing protein n=1 Tax=Oryza glumipatula TaxID=40148 RepID=A0A0E0A701_9ORYZ